MNPPAMFSSFSATKALANVLWLPGSDVRPCSGVIPETFMLGYKDHYSRKMEAGRSHSGNKSSISDSIEKHPGEDGRCNVGGERWRSLGGCECKQMWCVGVSSVSPCPPPLFFAKRLFSSTFTML